MRRLVLALALALALAAGVGAVALALAAGDDEAATPPSSTRVTESSEPAPPPPTEILPDLDQALPENVSVNLQDRRERITFLSAVDNAGAGSLLVVGRRSPLDPAMTLQQLVAREDGSVARYPVRSRLEYVRSETHEHWHLLGFDRYELRALDGSQAAPDQKTGFCLGDRYDSKSAEPPEQAPKPIFTGECGKGRPELLRVREGISPGYGDDYIPLLEGQYVDVTDVPDGRYLLVHRVNADRDLRESDYDNNAASVLVRLRRPPGGLVEVTVLASCPDRPTCGS
jgi:hypothetical protein